jgi:hypothetical protein
MIKGRLPVAGGASVETWRSNMADDTVQSTSHAAGSPSKPQAPHADISMEASSVIAIANSIAAVDAAFTP